MRSHEHPRSHMLIAEKACASPHKKRRRTALQPSRIVVYCLRLCVRVAIAGRSPLMCLQISGEHGRWALHLHIVSRTG